ncbi:MAG: hypothetical protein ABJG78_03545 [Cyclobacteriaceae bacterium]
MQKNLFCFFLAAAFIACEKKESTKSVTTISTKDIAACGAPASSIVSTASYKVKTIKLFPEALGVFERSVKTTSQKAQDYFNQGIQLRYAFAINEAISSFREAQKLDSTNAMFYWGEAWALGSYLNSHMRANKASLAFKAARKATELLGDNISEVDQALIEALNVRYIEEFEYEKRRVQDSLYADAMAKVYEQYPDDLDVGTLYAEALFLLEPRRGTREMDNPRLMIIHDVLEGVLAKNIEHPGACHLYIHATESTDHPELGESCADFLGNTIPGASHINHMPSHTYNEIGRWGDAVRANLQASLTDKRAKEEGTAISTYAGHNLHMLLYAASYDGQGAIAMQAGRDFTKQNGDPVHHVLTAIRFGRFDDVLETERPEKGVISQSIWDFCQGYAKLKKGEPDFAKLYLERVKATADTTKAEFRFEPGAPLLKVLIAILEGEISWEAGNKTAAILIFETGVKLDDALPYSEPEPLPFAARHWLGSAQLAMGQHAQAEQTYLQEIADHPRNGWSLYGLREALKAQSKSYEEVEKAFVQSWSRADVRLAASKF